jgi:hypothetical protein
MTTPPGQEPRPGFTPRGGQARPGFRAADSRSPDDDPRWRDEPRTRRPDSGGPGRPGGNPGRIPGSAPGNGAPGNGAPAGGRTREPGREAGDHGLDGRPPGRRPATGGRPPGGNAFRDGDRGYRGGPDRPGSADGPDPRGPERPGGGGGRDSRGGANDLRPEAPRKAAPTFSPASGAATRGTGAGPASKRPPVEAPRSGLLATPALRWIGRLPVKGAVLLFTGTVVAGTILTVVMGQEPGFLLGLFLILGSVAATATVRRGGVHKFIPLPALAYLIAATFTGLAHDSGSLNSSRQFVVDFLTWIGGSFVAVCASTILVVLIALTRWLLSGRLVSGQLPLTGSQRTPPRPTGRDPRGNRDPRGGRDQRGDRSPRGNPGPWWNQDRRTEGTWPSQASRGDRERPDEDTRPSQGRRDDRGRRDEGTGPSRGRRDDRSTWDRAPDGGPRDRRPRDRRDDRERYDQDPRDDPRSPSGPRDLW